MKELQWNSIYFQAAALAQFHGSHPSATVHNGEQSLVRNDEERIVIQPRSPHSEGMLS